MKLYAVEQKESGKNAGYYWAANESDAVNQHRLQTHEGVALTASPVWANNSNKAYRGYVVKEDNED